jgi:hypothetical protein
MATGYNKQSTYVDGNVITASLFNEDFGALQNAFAYTTDPSTTGHTHDGSAHQGGAISKIGDIDFNNKIEIDGTNNAIKLFIEVGGTTPTETLNLTASALSPSVASIDLGVSSQPFDVAYINSIAIPDSDGTTNRINLGAGPDFNIHYNANDTAVIQSTTASSVIDVDGKAGVKLKTDGTERLATTSTGVDVSGAFTVDTDVLVVDDTNNRVGVNVAAPTESLDVLGNLAVNGVSKLTGNVELLAGSDLVLYGGSSGSSLQSIRFENSDNDSSTSYIRAIYSADGGLDSGRTRLQIGTAAANQDGRTRIEINTAGSVLFNKTNGSDWGFMWDAPNESLLIGGAGRTPTEILDVVGNIVVSGTVDGRDLSVDGAKLDLIEANADVTDTVNVTAAGALMDSEVTNLAQVKAFNSSDYATSTQGTTADNALPKAGGEMTGNITFSGTETVDGRDLSVDGAKLDLIEASADVTDAVNVEAAGALMDTEVTNLDQVKAFDSSDYATAAQGTKADSALQNLVEDTSPLLGGALNLNSNVITGTGRISISQGAVATPAIELRNADTSGNVPAPLLRLSRYPSGTAEDGDFLGQVEFRGEDSGGTQLKYASIRAAAADVTPSATYGQLDFYNIKNGTDTKLMSLSPTALELDTGVALNTGGIVNSTGSTSKLTFDSSGTDVVTITGSQLGATSPNTDLALRCDKTISLQNVNLSVSGVPHNNVLTVNATSGSDNALTFFSKPHYPERTGLPLTTTSSPTPAIGTSDAVFVYDTTKDFDGGQWRLNLENESFQSLNRTLPKTMILEAAGNTLRVIDPSFREDPFVTTTISLDGISGLVISKIVAKNGYVLVYMAAQGSTGVVVLLDLIENNAIKYSNSGTLEYYASKNLPTIQRPDSVRYKVKSGYHTMTAIRNGFLSFPIADGKELNSNRPKVRVNLVGQTNSFVSYINKDEFSTSVFIDGTGLHGTNNQERNSVFVSSANSIVELVDDYDFSFTGYSSTSGNKSTLIKISERVASDSTLFRQYGTVEEIEQMSENGLAYLTSYGDEKSLTQLIPLRSLDQHDTSSTSPGLLFSKITESKVSGIVPNKSTGFTALSEIQGSTTTTAISTATTNIKSYQDKDIIMPFIPNLPTYEATALVATEAVGTGDTSVPLTRFNADVGGSTQLGAYGLPSEITDAGEDQNIIDIGHVSSFSVLPTKGFYLSFWIKFANSYTAAANEDIITIGQDDGKQIKIALDSNSLPALYRKDSGTTYSSATLDTPTGADAPDLTEWTNVTLLKPLGRTGLTRLIINGVEVDSVDDIMASSFYDVFPNNTSSTTKIITSHKYVLSLVKHYVPISTHSDSLTPAMVEKIYELEKPMFGPSTGITYLKPPSNVADKNFVTFNEHTKTLSVVNTAATIEYDGLSSKRVDTSLNRIQPTVAVSSGSNLLVGE